MEQIFEPEQRGELGVPSGAIQAPGRVHGAQQDTTRKHIEEFKRLLPARHEPFTDAYFLRTNQILKAEKIDPFVRASLFIRQGPGNVFGTEEALAAIEKYSSLTENGGRVLALSEGSRFDRKEPLMVIEARAQDIIELETMILGIITAETTHFNDQISKVSLDQVHNNVAAIRALIGDRSLVYGGARHWRYDQDGAIAQAAFEAGANDVSTDIGAATFDRRGVGTIPHALEVLFAAKYGRENAVKEATLAFDRHIDPAVPRIALVDFNNREVDDAIKTAMAMNDRLFAVRLDTCGENIAQLAVPHNSLVKDIYGGKVPAADERYWAGTGVTVTAADAVRTALDRAGFQNVRIILSSGFAKPEKVAAFVRAEKILGKRLFDGLLVGALYEPCRVATMDLAAVADNREDLDLSPMSKVGRSYTPNPRLSVVLGR